MGIGNVYQALGENQKALKYLNQALPIRRAVGDYEGEANTLNNIGVVYSDLGENQKALESFNQTLSIRRSWGIVRVKLLLSAILVELTIP
ncbi:MAG: tetratricopeptide repeat protein [Acaryochloridaceae cyanobacterium CSU_3_4]|nr:tetratricopeptide repeat protein [Acaryochloridaceae cyanobacterium CSU_3_4]